MIIIGEAPLCELGNYSLGLALVRTIVPTWGARVRDPKLMSVATPTDLAQFCSSPLPLRR